MRLADGARLGRAGKVTDAAIHGTKLIPTAATASAAAVESLAADILNGRAPSAVRAKDAAAAAVLGQRLGEQMSRRYANRLSRDEKEGLGEWLSRGRTRLRGEVTNSTAKTKDALSGGKHWFPDQRTTEGNIESKFGYRAALSTRQLQARAEGHIGRIDQWTPDHMGRVGGFFGGVGANHLLGFMWDDEKQ